MANKEKDRDIEKVLRIITGIVNVYSPLEIDEIIEKIEFYFPDDFAEFSYDEFYGIIELISEQGAFFIYDDDLVTILPEEFFEDEEALMEFQMMIYGLDEKIFEDPNEILKYFDLSEIDGCEEHKDLGDFICDLKYKNGKDGKDVLREIVMGIFIFADPPSLVKLVKDQTKEDFDEDELMELIHNLSGVVPRGTLHGYSLAEFNEMNYDGLNEMVSILEGDKIDIPNDYYKFGSYSYDDCLSLVNKLKRTKIFEQFCSDNLLELVINGEIVFVQLLGYYNGDRNVIVYGDRDNMEYNYHFMIADNGDYPDIDARVHYCEVVIDDNEGFLNDELKEKLVKDNYPELPLIGYYEPKARMDIPSQNQLNMIGAVLDSLLIIYNFMKDFVGERCEEGNLYKIIQCYLREDKSFEIGEYSYLGLGDVVLPVSMNTISEDIKINAKHEVSISIGLFAITVMNEDNPSYVAFVKENDSGFILGGDTCKGEDLGGFSSKMINLLEERDIKPNEIIFNNEFSFEVCEGLIDLYDAEYDISSEECGLNEVFYELRGGDVRVTSTGLKN